MMHNEYFPDFIGQSIIKTQLSFLLNAYQHSRILSPLLLVAKRGDGKSDLSRRIALNLTNSNRTGPKKLIEINSASVKTVESFVEKIIIPFVAGNKEVTLFCDEFAKIGEPVSDWLLSVLCPNAEHRTFAYHGGTRYDFDFRYFSFIGATTDAHLVSLPMKSRLRRLEFEPYSNIDLIKILHRNCDIEFRDNIEHEIVKVLRSSPRATVMMAQDIRQYATNENKNSFGRRDWENFKFILGILPLGLTRNELQLLRYLDEGPATLTCLSAKFSLSIAELRQEIELFPMASGLISIDGKRKLTHKGKELLESLKN